MESIATDGNGAVEGHLARHRVRNRTAKEAALICSATALFAARGYEATSTAEIAARAGCAEGLIHRYFGGKKGLLLALIQRRASQEVEELSRRLQLASALEEEFLQLTGWEVDNMWHDQEFLRLVMSRALFEPAYGKVLRKVVFSCHVPVFMERLKHFAGYRSLPKQEMEALAQSIKLLGLVFGFLRPVVLGEDRVVAKTMAATIANMIVRGITDVKSSWQPESHAGRTPVSKARRSGSCLWCPGCLENRLR